MTTTKHSATQTITLPSLGEGIEEATVSRWLAATGDPLDAGDPLVVASASTNCSTAAPPPGDAKPA
jgi:2-oxoglutarate dehydrogenase E2 component (dihydrolipoamide succinyltransferase)